MGCRSAGDCQSARCASKSRRVRMETSSPASSIARYQASCPWVWAQACSPIASRATGRRAWPDGRFAWRRTGRLGRGACRENTRPVAASDLSVSPFSERRILPTAGGDRDSSIAFFARSRWATKRSIIDQTPGPGKAPNQPITMRARNLISSIFAQGSIITKTGAIRTESADLFEARKLLVQEAAGGRLWVSSGPTASPASSCSPRSNLPAAEPQKVASVEGITEYQLDNGLRVLLFPDASQSKVTVNMTVLVGSRQEGYGETGMAHLLEHMVFKGTPAHPEHSQGAPGPRRPVQRQHLGRSRSIISRRWRPLTRTSSSPSSWKPTGWSTATSSARTWIRR